jgi:hypothetical protein
MHERAGFVPAVIIRDRLELDVIGGDLLVLELLIDLEIEDVAEAAFGRDLDAGEALLERIGAGLGRRWTRAGINRQRAFGFCLFIKLIERLGPRRQRREDDRHQQ